MNDFLSNPYLVELTLIAVTLVVTYLKGTKWYSESVLAKNEVLEEKVFSIFQEAVAVTYNNYVRDRKQAGAFDNEAKQTARTLATALAEKLASERGVDLSKVTPDKFIEQAVTNMKP